MLRAVQCRNEPAEQFIVRLEKQNLLLRGTDQYFDEGIRAIVGSHIYPSMRAQVNRPAITSLGFKAWKDALVNIDDQRRLVHEQVRLMFNVANASKAAPKESNPFRNEGTGNQSNRTWLPALSSEEWNSLANNKGCFKYQVPYVGHVARDCPSGYPDPKTYKSPLLFKNPVFVGGKENTRPRNVNTITVDDQEELCRSRT